MNIIILKIHIFVKPFKKIRITIIFLLSPLGPFGHRQTFVAL